MLLRRPAVRDKYIRSVSKDESISCYMTWDQAHVENKFPGTSEVLVRRLGAANTRRRDQLKFWMKLRSQSSEEASVVPLEPKAPRITIPRPRSNAEPAENYDVPALEMTDIAAKSLGVPSKATKQSFSIVAQSILAVNDTKTSAGRPRTVYKPSMQGSSRSLRIPDPPNVPFGRTTFDCPYCFMKLDVQAMHKRQLWK